MDTVVVRVERRGRKRKRKDFQNVEKPAVETRSRALVGSYLKKEFEGNGMFLGKVVHYDRGLYRIDYEDGDFEDLESGEVRQFLIRDDNFDDEWLYKKKALDELVLKKYAKDDKNVGNGVELWNAVGGAEASSPIELSNTGAHENNGVQGDGDADGDVDGYADGDVDGYADGDADGYANGDSSSDSFEDARDGDLSSGAEAEASLVPQPELPPSSGNIGVPDDCVADLLSVYTFLRSFSIPLFLSPFGLDDFVGSLNCSMQNTLLDAIHVALMRALRRHFEALSLDGSELASKCLRSMDWSLIDSITWPAFLVQYLMMMGYTEGLKWKGFYTDALQRDYYDLTVHRKLMVLQILCDDALDSAELRVEIDKREESEVVIESDGEIDGEIGEASEGGPGMVNPRNPETSTYGVQEAREIITKKPGMDAGADSNGDECRLCGMDGTLLCCDGCPSAYHSRCIGVSKLSIPEGEWYCPECAINNIGPIIRRGTSLSGAEFFGMDPYGQVFLGTCNYLLVIKKSMNAEPCVRYYNQKDIVTVLQALNSSVQHVTMYSELCKGIIQYWEIPIDVISSLAEKVEMGIKLATEQENNWCTTPSIAILDKNSNDIVQLVASNNFASCIAQSSSENMGYPCVGNIYDGFGLNKASLDTFNQADHPGYQQTPMSSGPLIQQADPSDLTQQKLASRSGQIGYTTFTLGNSSYNDIGHVNSTCAITNISSKGKVADCIYMGFSFKAQAYSNQYIHGDFAASAAANQATLSSEESRTSESHASNNYRKVISANFSLQAKAFSLAAVRFFWPSSEKKFVDVPRERCEWCFACRAPVQSRKACLLNAAASNAIKGTLKVLAGIRPVKNSDGSLHGVATFVMFMEESLRGLTVGPFLSSSYRKQWCEKAEQALTCSAIKSLLLELEENIRVVAFSGDWIKLVDGWPIGSSVTQNTTSAVGSSQKRGPGRRGRKPSAMPEVTVDDNQDISNDFAWWRGGMLSKFIFQKGILPRKMVKKSSRQGGSRKIPGIQYAEGIEVPKRSRRLVWRSAVEMSNNMSQIAAQIRYLDIHVRWGDLVRPEQSPVDGKGAEMEASAFRNAFICDKQIVENKIKYAVAFGNQKHLPSRVMKNVLEVEKSEDRTEKYWFLETRVPLYIIKEYEEKLENVPPSPVTEKPKNVLSKLQRMQLKASRKDIFSYLVRRRDNLDMCHCASCQFDVFLGNAVKCSKCEGYCHVQCTVSSTLHMSVEADFLVTCNRCYGPQVFTQIENHNMSPTSLLFPRQEPKNSVSAFKGRKVNGCNNMPLTLPNGAPDHSLGKKSKRNGSNSIPKKRSKILSWGLIWRKSNSEDTGIGFRSKNILPRGSPNLPKVACDLCKKPYNSQLMYISCERCKKWYHADAVELDESRLSELVGFKCCKCRRIKSPVCPYSDQPKKTPKQESPEVDPTRKTINEQLLESNQPAKEESLFTEGDDPLMFSLSSVDNATDHVSEVESEWNSAPISVPGPQKLPVRRQVKQENDASTPVEENSLLPAIELTTPGVKCHISTNDFEDDSMMFNYEDLNYEDMEFEPQDMELEPQDMEFEPQTYFTFTELLVSDDGGELDGEVDLSGGITGNLDRGVDPSGNITGNMGNSSSLPQNVDFDQNGVGMIDQHTDSLEPVGGDVLLCGICSHIEPNPDCFCQICGLWMHSHCSQWVEVSPGQGGWRCFNCQ